ncbi:HU family DNA-binding protein [Shewanella sp. NIFS-20-20]|uniref:HU family DNA-binding protein n=1 Tax=Shewanella sp. NIFS-20-20 TaxID=2853806 RepID=UPI001C43964E|nr:HU family DNA-binding protein [Shewanella sp. NIFS-20-20]MBV7315095.1 HU family DNA-binding protein [Shewanella sp. NIFS-20-20]
MNKTELSKIMATAQSCTQAQAKTQVASILAVIQQALMEGEKVYIPSFGTFELRYFLPKQGRHPQTGAIIEIAGANQPSFKPAPALKMLVNS